jgi:excisionase family DNA binding protein
MIIHRPAPGVSGSYPQVVNRTVCAPTGFARAVVDDCHTVRLVFGAMSITSDVEGLIRPGAAAQIAGVTTRTLARWADEGRLPVVRLPGGDRRYRRADVEAMMAPNTVA